MNYFSNDLLVSKASVMILFVQSVKTINIKVSFFINPLKPELTIEIFLLCKPRIGLVILDL